MSLNFLSTFPFRHICTMNYKNVDVNTTSTSHVNVDSTSNDLNLVNR